MFSLSFSPHGADDDKALCATQATYYSTPVAKNLTPDVITLSFIDCINRADVDGLAALMGERYALKVFDEPGQPGREDGIDGWRRYASGFPEYLIHPHRFAVLGDLCAVVGHTTGSHLGLPDDEESKLTLIWLGTVQDGRVQRWELIADTPENRERCGLG